MYNGLLPKGLTEDDLSSDDDCDDVNKTNSSPERAPENLNKVNKEIGILVEEHSPTSPIQLDESPTCALPGIPQESWQRFQELQKKKKEETQSKEPRRKRRRGHKKDKKHGTEGQELSQERDDQEEGGKRWEELKQYFHANERFQSPPCSKPPPKSGLEKSIENAIAEGDVVKAEEMSDRLATRELAVKIAEAAKCREYVQHKQEEEASRTAHKRKKIAWGFEAKKRWETKSNMGFM